MQNSASLAVIIIFFFFLLCQIGLGLLCTRIFQLGSRKAQLKLSEISSLGILISLHAILLFKNFGQHWLVAILSVCFAGFCSIYVWRDKIRLVNYNPSLNLILWCFAIFALGVSLFNHTEGKVSTSWVNNYGDLTFHLGMISSFTLGDIFPPEFHLYAGSSLSYPFLINLWSSTLWWLFQDYQALSVIFALQWSVLWIIIYYLLDGDKNWILPWALLLGGGSYFFLGNNSGKLISENKPWTLYLTTIWVTQRSTLLGLMGGAAALSLVLKHIRTLRESPNEALMIYPLLAGLLIGLSNIAHTHFALAFGIFIALIYLIEVLTGFTTSFKSQSLSLMLKRNLLPLLIFIIVGVLSAGFGLPYLLAKSGIIEIRWGWVTSGAVEALPAMQRLMASAQIWLRDASQILIAFVLFWIFSKRHKECLILALMFVLFNCVHAAPWTWDQIKFFIPLSAIFFLVWSTSEFKHKYLLQTVLLFSMLPCLFELISIMNGPSKHVVFDNNEIKIAQEIQKYIPEDSIIAASYHTHKSPAILSGRRLYAGYDGTLWSHGIKFDERRAQLDDLNKLFACKGKLCPDYLVWTRDEIKKYKLQTPDRRYTRRLTKNIYKIVR